MDTLRSNPARAEAESGLHVPLVTVTVVIPTGNRGRLLRRAVTSLLACDLTGLSVELRVVDDGSTDDTEQVVRDAQRAYSGPVAIHYHRQENSGPAAARNLGMAASRADIVAFLD